jgi:predicted negative regulator of RcsB-dependent stress response|tara:strand:+ start:877 stop:1521 length:645 start_codon:yes stop_codon:yes gene_type:complete
MDEEISIINSKTRTEKIRNFLLENKKLLISILVFLVLFLISFYSFQIYKNNQKELISDKYNNATTNIDKSDPSRIVSELKEVIDYRDSTYSPLALYFIIDNKLLDNQDEINELFDVLINKTSLEEEIKNLIIYKKALFNADNVNENQLLKILNPLINSQSVWKSHALYLMAEYFYSNNEKQKSKEFYNQILLTENANQDIIKEAQKRLNRDLSD